MKVKVNTVISFRYRFLDPEKKPLQKGRWFSSKGMVGGDDLPEFVSSQVTGKSPGEIVTVKVEASFPDIDGLARQIVPRKELPNRDCNPGDTISLLESNGSSRLMKVLEVHPDHIVALPATGNPQNAAFMEIIIDEVRWATPEEFMNRRASRSEKCHGGA